MKKIKEKIKKLFSKKKKKLQFKNYIYRLLFIIFVYILLVIFAKNIVSTFSFPWIFYNVQEFTWYIKTNLDFEEINIKDDSGNNINGLYVDAGSNKTIYYFHWNWWPLSFFYSEILYLKELWYNVMAYDYPWYGKSTGFPYESTVYDFSSRFYQHIKDEKWINQENIVIWGYSIWTTIATDFAYKNNVSKLVLVSPLSSTYDMSKKLIWFPIQKILFLPNSFISSEKIKTIKIPTLIIHWNNDKIVPFTQGKEIFHNSISENKHFIEIDNIWHNYIINIYWNIFKDYVLNFLENWKLDNRYIFIDDYERDIIRTRINNEQALNSFDYKTDSSIKKYVDPNNSFNSLDYTPEWLERISSKYVYDTKWWIQKLRKVANDALQLLAEEFYKEFWIKLSVISSYRSYEYQLWIKNRGCSDNVCAKAWYSEHQLGLAVDLISVSSKSTWYNNQGLMVYYTWLKKNAYKYGFHNSYQKWILIDWYDIEPWHWRYLWVDLSKYLLDKDLTFAEFFNSRN